MDQVNQQSLEGQIEQLQIGLRQQMSANSALARDMNDAIEEISQLLAELGRLRKALEEVVSHPTEGPEIARRALSRT